MSACLQQLVQYSQTLKSGKININWCLFSNPVPRNKFVKRSAKMLKTRPPSPLQLQTTPHTTSHVLENTWKKNMIISEHTIHNCGLLLLILSYHTHHILIHRCQKKVKHTLLLIFKNYSLVFIWLTGAHRQNYELIPLYQNGLEPFSQS